MNCGRKPDSPATEIARGTRRDRTKFQISAPQNMPQQPPDFLTPAGQEVWCDIVGAATSLGALEVDSVGIALLCNLIGDLKRVYDTGVSPPIAALAEARKGLELLGLYGVHSRVARGIQSPKTPEENPFSKYIADVPPRK